MVQTRPLSCDSRAMGCRRVTLVDCPTVSRKIGIQLGHNGVARGLCHNRSSCYISQLGIALDHRSVTNIFKWLKSITIDYDGTRTLA